MDSQWAVVKANEEAAVEAPREAGVAEQELGWAVQQYQSLQQSAEHIPGLT